MSFFDIDLALYLIPIPLEAEAADRNDARMEDQFTRFIDEYEMSFKPHRKIIRSRRKRE